MKKFILIYIGTRTLVGALYDVNIVGPIRITDLSGFIFLLVAVMYLSRARTGNSIPGQSIVLLPLVWLIFSSFWVIATYGNIFQIYFYSKQVIRFANGVMAFLLFARVFTSYEDVIKFARAVMFSTLFPLFQIVIIATFGPGAFGMQAVAMDDYTLVSGVYGNYGVFATSTYLGLISLLILWSKSGLNRRQLKYYTVAFISYIMAGLITVSRILFGQMMSITAIFLYSLSKRRNFGVIVLFSVVFVIAANTDYFETQTESLLNRSEYEFDVIRGEKGREYAMHGRVERWETTFDTFYNDYPLVDQILGTDIHIGPHGDYFYWLFAYGWIGFMIYLRLNYHIIINAFRTWRHYKDTRYRMFGAALLSTAAVWVISALGTTPSFMPDTLYTVLGLMGISMNTDFLKEGARPLDQEKN